MAAYNQSARYTPESAPQEAYLAIEVEPADEAETERLLAIRKHVAAHTHQTDLRHLAPDVREMMGEGYQVVCGSSHIWMKREGQAERLAVVADRLTTAYRDWCEPPRPAATGNTQNALDEDYQ